MSDDSKWKKELLKSGLLFEKEVLDCFEKRDYLINPEFFYSRKNESDRVIDFSCDGVASFLKSGSGISFLIECKYKTTPTKWFFIPDSSPHLINRNDFLHPIDFFIERKFEYNLLPSSLCFEPLGKQCLKGIELFQNQGLETNITKSLAQISYGFHELVIDSIKEQAIYDPIDDFSTMYFNIPIIITNAELYLANEDVTTNNVISSKEIDEIGSREDFLIYRANNTSNELFNHNLSKFTELFEHLGDDEIYRSVSSKFHNGILAELPDMLSLRWCPRAIVIMHHDNFHNNYDKLIKHVHSIVWPDKETLNRISELDNDEFLT